MSRDGTAAGMLRFFMLREAVASVALSHAEDCDCLTCRASHGDMDAFAEVTAGTRAGGGEPE